MEITPPGYLRPRQTKPLTVEEETLVTRTCPGLSEHVEAKGRTNPVLWGPYVSMKTGWSRNPALRFASSSGGALSAILVHLLETGIVDAVVQTAADPDIAISNATVITTNIPGITAAAGSRYAPSAPLSDLRTLQADGRRFAFVGKPCDAAALRALMHEEPDFARVFPIILSFFCAGVPSQTGGEKVLAALGTNLTKTARFRFRGNGWPGYATATDHDGVERSMSYHDSWGGVLSKHVQHRCKICADGIGIQADIVCADAWDCDELGYPKFEEAPGISLIVARTVLGNHLLKSATEAEAIVTEPFDISTLAQIQPGQRDRRRSVLARLLALRLLGRPVPDYRGLHLPAAGRLNPPLRNARNFVGMLRRALLNRL